MEWLMKMTMWLKSNYTEMLIVLAGLIPLAEFITRMTKTKKDDGFVKRIGGILDKMMNFFKVPNRLKKPEPK